ncbi:MAG: hypothetical protein CUN55_04880 [Phototrophicales bacterium]|nr:MAG: hypothetical protein CUN55_04880 [Phototrophicales bacterium]
MTEPIATSQAKTRFILDRLIIWFAAYFGSKSKEVERFLRFAIVGTIGAIVDFGVLNILQSTILPPSGPNEVLYVRLATGTSFTLAVINNFIWNRYWTYPDSRSRPILLQIVQFFIVNTTAVFFRLIFVGIVYAPLGELVQSVLGQNNWNEETVNQVGTNAGQAIASGIAMFWNFFVNRYWTYSDVE